MSEELLLKECSLGDEDAFNRLIIRTGEMLLDDIYASHSDVRVVLLCRRVEPMAVECFLPRLRVSMRGIDECSVEVEDGTGVSHVDERRSGGMT